MEYKTRDVESGEENDRQKSGSPLVNLSTTFIDGHLAAEILARTEREKEGVDGREDGSEDREGGFDR